MRYVHMRTVCENVIPPDDTDGEVDFFVRWRGHQDEDRTWGPLEQLVADVPVLVAKYVQAHDDCPDLVVTHKKVVRAARTKKTT